MYETIKLLRKLAELEFQGKTELYPVSRSYEMVDFNFKGHDYLNIPYAFMFPCFV